MPLGAALGVGASSGGGFAAGFFSGKAIDVADPVADYKAAETVDALAKPANELLCYVEPWRPHAANLQAAIKAFCDNLPNDPVEFVRQQVAIFKALNAEKAAAASEGAPP